MYIGPYRPPRSMTSTVEDTRGLRVGHLVAVLHTDCIPPAIGEVLQLRHEEIEVKWLEGTYNSTWTAYKIPDAVDKCGNFTLSLCRC